MPLYFAYGSNLDRGQMQRRCPKAWVVGEAILDNHRLTFAGSSATWGDLGVATCHRTPGRTVRGLVWHVSAKHMRTLDRCEGAPWWYHRERFRVTMATGRKREAWVYMLPESVPANPPCEDYFDQIRRAHYRAGWGEIEITKCLNETWDRYENQSKKRRAS